MQGITHSLHWLRRPQFLAGFVMLCLVVSGIGLATRPDPEGITTTAVYSPQHVKGATAPATALPPPADCAVARCLALTFDDGPDRRVTPQILDILQRQQVQATFFLVGREVPGKEDIVRRIHQQGNEIGNHSYNHADFTQLIPQQIRAEFESTQRVIANTGVPVPQIFRPPYGAVTPQVRAHIPVPMIRWDIDTQDWETQDLAKITEHLMQDTHPGAIILMHDKYDATVQSLEPTIAQLKQQYTFVTVSQLMQLNPGDQGQFFGRE